MFFIVYSNIEMSLNVKRLREMRLLGYARFGKSGENLEQQINILMDYGLEFSNIFQERRSSLDGTRPILSECLKMLQPGDKLVVTRLSQLVNSFMHLSQIKNYLEEQDAHLSAIKQGVDTANNSKIDIFALMTAFCEFDMEVRVERQLEGIFRAKQNGIKFGRKPVDKKIVSQVQDMYKNGESVGQISVKLALGRSTIYRLIK